ncbi:MAG: calcium/sodium antiporter [Deltaproteobacteria bacterium]|nr:calcium/sodium antiporter [Deltaproteobacteria bacterium]
MFLVSLLIGLVALVGGAELLVRGGGELALKLRIPALVVGLTVVAFGTSTPELAVSVTAAWQASTQMALANVNGSNIANVLLVLGLGAMVSPIRVERSVIKRDLGAAMLLSALVPLFLLTSNRICRGEGVVLVLVGVIYNVLLLRAAFSGRVKVDPEEVDFGGERHWAVNLLMLVAGVVVLVVGAGYFVDGAVILAERLGFSDRFIGLTVVAVGTSAPEIATSMVSAFRGESDMAVGNSVGSNILNISMVLGITAIIYPIDLGSSAVWWDTGAVLVSMALLLPLALWGRVSRGTGALMIAVYAGYMFFSQS